MPFTQLSAHLVIHHGVINVGVVRDGDRALLIDHGDGDVWETLAELGIAHVDAVLFTHHHRDQAAGVRRAIERGACIGVPAAERALFDDVGSYWNDPANRWHLYHERPHHWMLPTSVHVDDAYVEGEIIDWGPARITVWETPGHTDGSLSYLVDLSDEGCYAFCGDCLFDHGQLWDLYSLQKGWSTHDYHGFLGDRQRLVDSLRRLGDSGASALIPSHGRVMRDPPGAVEAANRRLEECYRHYVAISALRHYFPDMFAEYMGLDIAMPFGPGEPIPDFLTHVGTSWVVSSQDGPTFLLDCGRRLVVSEIRKRQRAGEWGAVEGLWITHYHDDHVDEIPYAVETFGCPVITDQHVAQVVQKPLAWRAPCISPSLVRVDRITTHGETWQWREFAMTAYHLPGQTFYHGGLLVEGHGLRLFFVGDSFTMSGVDDYCAGNRNWLGQGVGFDACLSLVQELQPDLMFNCHVDAGFRFSSEQCRFMRANLARRERLFGDLVPWDHPNYALDEHWVLVDPYEQIAVPGQEVAFEVVVTNHSPIEREVICSPELPERWGVARHGSALIEPKGEGRVPLVVGIPPDAGAGRWVVPIDVTYGGRRLGQFREAILVVQD